MNQRVVVRSSKPTGCSRSMSVGSNTSSVSSSSSTGTSSSAIPSPPSSELCALIRFAYRLGSVVHNNDPNLDWINSDVRREAKLLMSLACSSPINPDDENTSASAGDSYNISHSDSNDNNKQTDYDTAATASTSHLLSSSSSSSSTLSTATSSGRITPTHSITSISSGGSRRDIFCFTCPSLSLDNTRGTTGDASPGIMLSRTLKVDDQDAMRLSSEAMARNIIESFQKAIDWRIQSWVGSLSRVLVIKELELKKSTTNKGNTKATQQLLQQELYFSNEALLVKTLREIEGKVQVLEATTAFKVLNKVSQVDETGSALKKRRTGDQEDRAGLEEGEYVYDVIHVLEMQCSLNISTPAGNIQIDLNVPGKIKGTFFSSEDDDSDVKLTDVTIHINTDMMASMIEKSSRIAVRTSSEAMLKGDQVVSSNLETTAGDASKTVPQEQSSPTKPASTASQPQTRSPKRKIYDANVSGLVVITPARNITDARNTASSPSCFGESSDSDGDHNQPVLLQIPDNFLSSGSKHSGKILQPLASRAAASATPGPSLDFAARLPPKKYMLQQKMMKNVGAAMVVTPLRTKGPEYIEREKGPNLPILMEAAGIRFEKK